MSINEAIQEPKKKKNERKKIRAKRFHFIRRRRKYYKGNKTKHHKESKDKNTNKRNFYSTESAIKNSLKLYDKRADIINASLIKISISEIKKQMYIPCLKN